MTHAESKVKLNKNDTPKKYLDVVLEVRENIEEQSKMCDFVVEDNMLTSASESGDHDVTLHLNFLD